RGFPPTPRIGHLVVGSAAGGVGDTIADLVSLICDQDSFQRAGQGVGDMPRPGQPPGCRQSLVPDPSENGVLEGCGFASASGARRGED
ncbi:hypothetical protein EIJ04_18995, partial [Xanthomonas perforans]